MYARQPQLKECRMYKEQGYCRFGTRCKYSHVIERPEILQELFTSLEISSKPTSKVKVALGIEQRKQLREFLKSCIPNEKRGVVQEQNSDDSDDELYDNPGLGDEANGFKTDVFEKHLEETYKHIPDSTFKREFLQNIMGNYRANKGSLNEVKCTLQRDPTLDLALKTELCKKINENEKYQEILQYRQRLPVYKKQGAILENIYRSQVILITGETGSGKTTQVAQFILDEYININRGSLCHVVCTQPRRMSAIAVAERVAYERGEMCGSESSSVGYQIRLDKKLPRKQGSIIFCTTGILLQWLQSDPGLTHISHVIIDEIHERNMDTDFVMTVLREILPQRRDLRVLLMSATLNAQKFAAYFNNCSIVEVPGNVFPVEIFYLEDALSLTGYVREGTGRRPPRSCGINEFADFIVPYAQSLMGRFGDLVIKQLVRPESEHIDLELIQRVIEYICENKGPGAILVFLPGWDYITNLCKKLTSSDFFCCSRQVEASQEEEEDDDDDDEGEEEEEEGGEGEMVNDEEAEKRDTKILTGISGKYLLLPLHSRMPTVNQSQVFDRPPPGVRKIIVATNIAETSITIDDVVYIIDSGKMKMKNYDGEKNLSTLQDEWVSKANALQRRGRAGRVQPGECYHLFTKARERLLDRFQKPEILRTRLEELVLTIKILQLGKVHNFLCRIMDSPDQKIVDSSVQLLRDLGALDCNENLTPLGFHLARLPLDPHIGKMIILSAIFSCVDPILSIAACLSFKEPFVVPAGRDKEVINKKIMLSHGSKSDHLVLAQVMKRWEKTSQRKSYKFCRKNFLSLTTLRSLRDMKIEFAHHLHEMGFLKTSYTKHEEANVNSNNLSVLKAVICAGLYPNFASVQRIERYKIAGKIDVVLTTPEDGRVKLHRSSINESQQSFESPYLMYMTKMKSSHIFLHDTTMVSSLPLILFSHKIQYDRDSSVIRINANITFNCDKDLASIVQELRQEVQKVLDKLIIQPGTVNWNLNEPDTQTLRTALSLISQEDQLILSK